LLLAPLVAAAQMTPADIAKKAIPAVVFIKGLTIDGKEATGSGFIVDPSGVIVTNLHVVQGLKTAAVKLANGDVYDQVNIKAFDERKDLAVIQIQGFSLPTLEMGNSDELQPGVPVTLVGNPMGLEGSVSTGVVSGIRNDGGFRVIQTDAAANPGNSGGPLLDGQGKAVGVLSFKLRGAESLNFCIPINYARGMLTMSTGSLSLDELAQKLGKTEDLFSGK
jgi:S1-C subfamily serine protease